MASASPQTDDIEDEQFQARVKVAIGDVVKQILNSRNQPLGHAVPLQSNFDQIIIKIHEILTKLDQLYQGLTRSIESSSLRSTFLSSMSPVSPNEVLEEIEGYRRSFETFLQHLSRLHTSSNDMYLTVVQMAIEGVEIPTLEDFYIPPISISTLLLSSAANAFQSTIQETNVAREMAKCLILKLARHFALISHIEKPLFIVADFILQLPVSIFMVSFKLTEQELSICSKIATLKQQLDASGIKHRIYRIDRYLSLEKEDHLNYNAELSLRIWNTYRMVKASVNSCKKENLGTSDMEIINEIRTQPHCAGLVEPIVSYLHCSVEEAWDIIHMVFSRVHPSSVSLLI